MNFRSRSFSLLFTLLISIAFSNTAFAQPRDHKVKVFLNNKKVSVDSAKLLMITGTDTIQVKLDGDKAIFPALQDGFQLAAKVDSVILNLGKFKMADLLYIKTIALGTITDLGKLYTRYYDDQTYLIDKFYPLTLEEPSTIKMVYFFILDYEPKFSIDTVSRKFQAAKKVVRK